MSNTAWCKKIQTAAWRCQQNMNKVLHTYTYVNKLWSKTQNWFIQYNYLFYFKKYKDNSFSKFFMLIQTNSKKTIAISKAISTFIVFPSMYFPSLFVLRETSTSNSPQLRRIAPLGRSLLIGWERAQGIEGIKPIRMLDNSVAGFSPGQFTELNYALFRIMWLWLKMIEIMIMLRQKV